MKTHLIFKTFYFTLLCGGEGGFPPATCHII